ncbi:hypothetical protein QBC42DRAFT_282106 [Cladorrhinum samala]|uniref:Uncharacterized protein n=1 Tax=Cladorrhinum samala TaxID=585594 RepID=A0AAV9I0T2_9PEZI|nr:hypothetical protein QBC42DRAFT_282106 [Cladorrhinum samala]
MSNYSYPRAETAQAYQQHAADARGSVSSNPSVPGTVQDFGSDSSTDEECATSALWDSCFWHNTSWRQPSYPAVATEGLAAAQEIRPATRGRTADVRSQPVTPYPSPCSLRRRRSGSPKPPSRGRYKLFPPPVSRHPHASSPISTPEGYSRASSVDSQSSHEPLRPIEYAGPSLSRSFSSLRRRNIEIWGPPMDMGPPLSPDQSVYSCEDDIPILSRDICTPPPSPRIRIKTRAPPPSPEEPVSPSSRSPVSSTAVDKTFPEPPVQPWLNPSERRPPLSSLRNVSLSKLSTRSTPSLSQKSKAQNSKACSPVSGEKVPSSVISYMDRPLPPLPAAAAPSRSIILPNISVFEADSDSDSDDDEAGETFGGESKSLAKRLMRGLALTSSNPGRRARSDAGLTYQRASEDCAQPKSPTKFFWGRRGRAKSTAASGANARTAAAHSSSLVSSAVAGNTAEERERHLQMLLSLSRGEEVDVNAAVGTPSSSSSKSLTLRRRIFGSWR